MTPIRQYERKGRIYVQLEWGGTTKTMPRANYNWLKANPIFEEVPPGYVVHHLDHDPLNDDTSNLVIMYKLHHIAYHFKQKVPTGEVKLRKILIPGIPSTRPRVYRDSRSGKFHIIFYERGDGTKAGRHCKIFRDENGNLFYSEKEADDYIDRFWKEIQELNSLTS